MADRTVTLVGEDQRDYDAARTRPTETPTDTAKTAARHKRIVKEALDRFKLVNEAEQAQRDREVEDLKFDRALPEDQWPEHIRKARAGGTAPDGTVVHERPCLVIPKLDVPVQQVINEARKARLAIMVKAKGNGATKDGAALRQGMIRAIENDSRAHIARIWALERAAKCGRGAYRVLKTYANDGDFDLDLVVARIKNQGSVYLDPFASEPDWSDGEWAFITETIPVEEYNRLYKRSALAEMSAEELQSVADKSPGWVTTPTDGKTGAIRVAEYFYVEYETRTLIQDPATGEKTLLPAGASAPPGVKSREVDKRQVRWCVINAEEVLDEEDWDGRYIPIIPLIGKEYNVDGESTYKGIISNAKDAQRLYNYARSSQALRAGLESLAPYVMAEGQDDGYEAMWDEANTRAFTRLKYRPTSFEGHLVPPPQRNDLSSTNLSASLLLAQAADADIQATTGRYNPSLGRQDSQLKSGKAINALKQQGETASSNYLENLASISMVHEARILLDLLKYVYDRPGRIVRLLGDDPKDEREVMLGQPFVPGPEGRPMPTDPNTPGLIPALLAKMKGGKPPEKAKTYDLGKDEDYTVSVTVGQSFASQKDANAGLLGVLMQAAPGLTPQIADIYVEQFDNPMGDRLKKRLQKLNPQLQDEDEDGGGMDVPPQVQAQMQQMGQQLQQLQAALQQAQQEKLAETAKINAQIQMKQMELASQERIAAGKIQAETAETSAELGSKESIANLQSDTKLAEKQVDAARDARKLEQQAAQAERAADRADIQADQGAVRDAVLKAPAVFIPPDTDAF